MPTSFHILPNPSFVFILTFVTLAHFMQYRSASM
jgi:hypothetical protein